MYVIPLLEQNHHPHRLVLEGQVFEPVSVQQKQPQLSVQHVELLLQFCPPHVTAQAGVGRRR